MGSVRFPENPTSPDGRATVANWWPASIGIALIEIQADLIVPAARYARGLQTSRLRPRLRRAGPTPNIEGWGSADRRPVLARHRWPACEAGRGACEAPRRPLRSGRRASR